MEKIGFGFFGRPIDHKHISNGLFKSLQLEGETYLYLPNNVNLAKGERVVKISRQAYGSNMLEIIKVYIFDYAKSFNSRSGGFIGSAYVFMGNPTQTLLYNAIKHIHPKVFNLLNENGKFKDKDFNISADELINPATNGLIIGNPQKSNAPLKNDIYTILTDGPVLNHLMSVVQGFMYNPDFKSLESIYVSDNKDLLRRITRDDKKILGIGHLLNFNSHFQRLNKSLTQKREVFNQLKKSIEEEKRSRSEKIEGHLSEKQEELKNTEYAITKKKKGLEDLKNNYNQQEKELKKVKENYETEYNQTSKKIKRLKEEVEKESAVKNKLENEIKILQNNKYNSFERLLEDKRFKPDKEKYLHNNSEIGKLNKRIAELETERKEREEKKVPLKKKLAFLAILASFFLIVGYSFSLIPVNAIGNKLKNVIGREEGEIGRASCRERV